MDVDELKRVLMRNINRDIRTLAKSARFAITNVIYAGNNFRIQTSRRNYYVISYEKFIQVVSNVNTLIADYNSGSRLEESVRRILARARLSESVTEVYMAALAVELAGARDRVRRCT